MSLNRREFVAISAFLGAAVPLPADEIPSISFPTAARDRLAVSSYPFRAFIDSPRNRARNPQAKLMDLTEFPRMVADRFGVRNVEFLGEHIRPDEPARLKDLRAAVESAGSRVINIPANLGASAYDPEQTRRAAAIANGNKWVDAAVALNCASIRVHIQRSEGATPDVTLTSETLTPIARYGASHGVVVNLENDDLVTEDAFFIAKVIDRVNSPWLRALPDFCNSMMGGDEKFNYDAVKTMFDRAYNISHVKDSEVERGKVFHVDLARTFGIARAAAYRGYFSMEFEGEGDPYEGTRKLVEASLRSLS